MKKIITVFTLLICVLQLSAQSQEPPEFWENENLNEHNREPIHATYFAYENKDLALKGDRSASKDFQSLNGDWIFKWVDKPADKPLGFWRQPL